MESRKFSCFDLLVTFISFLTYIVDIGTDVVVVGLLYLNGSDSWGSVMLVFTVVPLLVMNVFSLKWHATDAPLTPSTVLIHLFFLAPIHRYVSVLYGGYKSYRSGQRSATERVLHELNDVSILRLLETFLEAAPQLVIQLYVMVMWPHAVHWLQGLSAGCSLVSLAWALTAYSDTAHLHSQPACHRRLTAMALHCAWRLMMVSARVTALVLFASVLHAWLVVFAGVHWCVMTVWIWHQGADFGRSTAERVLFRVALGFTYVFVFLNVHGGPSRQRMACYYCVVAVENAALFAVWCRVSQASSGMVAAAATVLVMGFVLGLGCLVVYYGWLHPSPLFSATPTVATQQHGTPQSAQEQRHQGGHSSLHTPSPANSSTPDIPHQTPQRGADKGGNLTLSFLLDSATKGELQWYSGVSSSEADSQCSSGLNEDDGLSFSLPDSVTALTATPTSLSPPSTPFTSLSSPSTPFTSQSPPSTPFTSQSPPSTPFTSLSPPSTPFTSLSPPSTPFTSLSPPSTPFTSLSPPSTPFTSQSPPSTVTPDLSYCSHSPGEQGGGGGWSLSPLNHTSVWYTSSSSSSSPCSPHGQGHDPARQTARGGRDQGKEWRVCGHCEVDTKHHNQHTGRGRRNVCACSVEGGGDTGVEGGHSPHCSASTLSARSLLSDAGDSNPPIHPESVSDDTHSGSSVLSPLSARQLWRDSLRRVISATVARLFPTHHSPVCSVSAGQDSSVCSPLSGNLRHHTCGDLSAGLGDRYRGQQSLWEREELSESGREKSRPQTRAPLAQPESSDISGRSSPSVCVRERPPPLPPSPLSGSSCAAVSRSLPSDLPPSPPSPLSSSVDLPHHPCDLLRPSHSCCPLHRLRLNPAPPVGPEGGPEGGVIPDRGMVCLLHQLPTASVDCSRRGSRGPPLSVCCLDHSPHRLGRSVDLFDPQAWRQRGGCSHPCRPRQRGGGEEGGCGVSGGEVWFAESVHASACGQEHHHRAAAATTAVTITAATTTAVTITAAGATTTAAEQGEGLYRYFIHPDSPVSNSGWTLPCGAYLDPNPGSPAVPGVWTTLTHSCGRVSSLSKPGRTHGPSTDPRRKSVAKGQKSSARSVTWEDDRLCEEEDTALKVTARKTSHHFSRLDDKDRERKPLKSVENSPHFAPLNSPGFKPRSPLQDMTNTGHTSGQREKQHGSGRAAVTASVDRRASSSEGRPPVTRRPQQSRYRQAAGRKADRRSAARASAGHPSDSAGHPSVSGTRSPPGLEMII